MDTQMKKRITVILLELTIALIFIIGINENNYSLSVIYHSYFADIAIPFGFYFLLIPSELTFPILIKWENKACVIFILCSTSEVLQYFGIFALARIFDPIDFIMYGIGVTLAAFVDRQIFKKIFKFWSYR